MTQDRIATSARRFVATALKMYQCEREFTITPGAPEELEATVAAFEALGCSVAVSSTGVLTVTCP